MATSFPSGLDALTNPTSSDGLNSPDHAGQHANANDAIEALEAKVGVNGSAVTTSLDYKITNGITSGLNVSSGDLYVDVVNARVGVNTINPQATLDIQASTVAPAVRITNNGTNDSFLVEDSTSTDSTPFVISSTGNVGIGLTNPAAKLDVVGNTTIQGALTVTGDVTVDTNTLKVDSTNNRVGIANASPAYTLDVNGTVEATQFLQGTDYLSPYQGFRNKAINGGFDIWQRGTSFSNPASGSYIADRTSILYDGSGATRTISQGQFDPYVSGASITATPPTGTSPTYFLRYNQSVAGSGATYNILYINRTEDVRVLAGKTVTVSFYAKAAANLTIGGVYFEQVFGSGGSPSSNVYSTISNSTSVTTSWQRFSYTVAVPSASGKVIGSSANSSYTGILMYLPINTTFTLDIWGLQVEEGSVATPFEQRPIQQELALCQRYYFRTGTHGGYVLAGFGPGSVVGPNGNVDAVFPLPVPMRIAPTSIGYSTLRITDYQAAFTIASITLSTVRTSTTVVQATVSTTSAMTLYRPYVIEGNNSTSAYFEASAEM